MATKKLKTTPIKTKGKIKNYVMVNERVKAFRELYPSYPLITEIVSMTDKRVVMKATVYNADGVALATGYAYEDEGAGSEANRFSFIENCETSAIGRALGCFGIGIDESYCTGDELLRVLDLEAQEKAPKEKPENNPDVAQVELPTADEFGEILQEVGEREKSLDRISELLNVTGITPQQFIKTMGVNNVYELSDEQIADAIKRLEKKANESAGDK